MAKPDCSCSRGAGGNAETGPYSEIIDCDPACPEHGRLADPDGWADHDEAEANDPDFCDCGELLFPEDNVTVCNMCSNPARIPV